MAFTSDRNHVHHILMNGDICKHFLIGVVAQSANVGTFAGTKRLRSLRRMNAAKRWRSDAPAKPHQALEACINLAMTTERKIVCSETSSMPWARKTLRACKVCALELTTALTYSTTERLFVKVTPRKCPSKLVAYDDNSGVSGEAVR